MISTNDDNVNSDIPTDTPATVILPHPGQNVDRDDPIFRTFELSLDPKSHKNEKLKSILASYGLQKSGSKAVLLARLREFANHREQWASLVISARGRQRGDVSEQVARKCRTAQRIVSTFGAKETEHTYKSKKSGSEFRPIVLLSPHRIATNDAWALKVLERCQRNGPTSTAVCCSDVPGPGISTDASRQSLQPGDVSESLEQPRPIKVTSIRRLEHRVISYNNNVMTGVEDMRSRLVNLESLVGSLAVTATTTGTLPSVFYRNRLSPGITLTSHAPGGTAQFNSIIPHTTTRHPQSLPSGSESSSTAQRLPGPDLQQHATRLHNPSVRSSGTCSRPEPYPIDIPRDSLMVFELDGEELRFDKTAVPNPPKVSFADDISRLFREWHESRLLIINGRGIPIKHWERFYKRRTNIKDYAWDSVGKKWGNWKFIVEEREHFPSEAAFWTKYSDENGVKLTFQKLLDTLKDDRKQDYQTDAAAALWFFDNDLSTPTAHGVFHYKKSGKTYICQKPQKIAERWRKLLRDHPDVASQWELVRHNFAEDQA